MTPNDVTQPFEQPITPHAWPQQTPRQPMPRQSMAPPPRGRRAGLWIVLAFVAGCVLTAIIALAALAPAPAPSASAQNSGAALKVTLTDALLTTAMNSSQATGQTASAVTLDHPRAHIQANGDITISGVLQGTSMASGSVVTIVAQPYVSQNTLAVKVLRASVAGFALPPSLLNTLRDQINQQLAQSSHVSLGVGQGLVVSGVSFADGSMTLSYAPAAG